MQIFLSYAREDRRCAELLADALSKRGWSVWWDRRLLFGEEFSRVIERELKKAQCVIVLWSHNAVESDWVCSEARAAAQRDVLVPIRIEDVWPPLEFNGLHTADLLDWEKGLRGPEFEACLTSIAEIVAPGPEPPQPKPEPETEPEPEPEPKIETRFCIRQDGREFRVPDVMTLRRWAAEGRVRAGSTVFDPRVQRWSLASEVPDLRSSLRDLPPAATPKRSRTPLFLIAALAVGGLVLMVVGIYAIAQYQDTYATADYEPTTPAATGAVMPAPQPPWIQVWIENRCDSPISVAICNLDAATHQLMCSGWYPSVPGQTTPTPVRAAAPDIYFYVGSEGETWHSGKDAALMAPIHPARFVGTLESLKAQPGMTPVPFFLRAIDPAQPSHTEVICP